MSETKKARITPNRMVSMVWFIPLVSVIIGLWMLIQNVKEQGPQVTLHMTSADGIEVNKTVVKVLSVEVGRVTNIKLNENQVSVDVKVQLNADTKDLLKEDTKFWVVKPRIDQGGVQGLGTLLSGAYIEFSPGTGEQNTYSFNVLPDPPITASNQKGLRIRLSSTVSKLIPIGNPVLYRDVNVGRIEKSEFNPVDQKTHYQIFIDKPYDSLVHNSVSFWITSGLDIKTSPEGIKVRSGSLATMLGGGISFGAKPGTIQGAEVAQNSQFALYSDFDKVELSPSDRAIYYVVLFDQSVRGLVTDAPVEYKGIRIGSVAQMPFYDKDESLSLLKNNTIPVLIRIDPERMEINAKTQDKAYWEKEFQNAIQKGLHAKLQSNSLLMGGLFVDLSISKKPLYPAQKLYADYTVIPSVSGGLDQLQDQISSLLDKLNSLPLESTVKELNATLAEVRKLTRSLDKIAGANDTQNIPRELNSTLKEVRKTLQGISPDSPLYGEVQSTLKSLNNTLQQIEPTVKTLQEQPNVLIFNRSNKDPIPKGNEMNASHRQRISRR